MALSQREREKETDYFIDDVLVGVKIEGETGVTAMCASGWNMDEERGDGLFFDEDARSPLGGLGANIEVMMSYSNSSLMSSSFLVSLSFLTCHIAVATPESALNLTGT